MMKRFIKISNFLIFITNLLFGISSPELAGGFKSGGRKRKNWFIQGWPKRALLLNQFGKGRNF